MKKLLLTAALILVNQSVICQELATTESGKTVQLFKNGTYKYIETKKPESTKLKQADFKIENGNASIKNEIFVLDGDEKIVKIKFSFFSTESNFKALDIDKLNEMISKANIKSMFQMKNRRTYVPKEMMVFYSDKSNEWVISTEYTAQNDYGATKDGTTVTSFSIIGEFLRIVSI